MKNTFGESIAVTLFGESHGPAVGAVVDGLAPGLPVSEAEIERELARRRPAAAGDTARREEDRFRILSGVFNGRATGTPLTIVIPNGDVGSGAYDYGPARPSHADFAARCKYHGYEDYRGGGHFSGRVTAALAAVGGILRPALAGVGVRLATHVLRCGGEADRAFAGEADLALLERAAFPALDPAAGERMAAAAARAKAEGDSVGGVTQTAVFGLPAGLGEPWFDSVEGVLAHALYSVGGVKGVEFGDGFALAALRGSEANDPFRMAEGKVVTETNRSGGINGGITNGMPVIFQCAVRPTPSIAREQRTVNFLTGEETGLSVRGRHDAAIVRRICPVIDSLTAVVLADLLARRYGTDVLMRGEKAWNTD